MHFIIEIENQLNELSPVDDCFVQVIANNSRYHPKLTGVSVIYYHNGDKGYCLCINHSESFSISLEKVVNFLSLHKTVYVYDKKYHSYFIDSSNLVDLYINQLNIDGVHNKFDCDTTIHKHHEQVNSEKEDINQIIPISKHYEKYEKLRELSTKYMVRNEQIIDLSNAYKLVEDSGIKVDLAKLNEVYSIQNKDLSIKDSVAYTSYNLYNTTGRPTNSFGGINYLAIPKDQTHRECFIPSNDYLVEFDFDAYHPRLIAKHLGLELPKESLHEFFGKQYFKKDHLTPEEYKESKEITFRQLYGGVQEAYKHIEFFSKMQKFIDELYFTYLENSGILLPTGVFLKRKRDLTKYKVFNYFVQNLETLENYNKIREISYILHSSKTKLILITYDSFLFDFSVEDGKDLLSKIKLTLESNDLIVKHKYSKTYNL
jgi:hypothetical protein